MATRYHFSLQLSSHDYLRYYQGTAGQVQVLSECGKRLSFPASRLRPFLTSGGVRGRFELTVDADNRVISFTRLA